MNVSDVVPSATLPEYVNKTVMEVSSMLVTSLPTQANATTIQVMTELPKNSESDYLTIVAVVSVVMVLTLAALGFFLYRYLCHNKGDYVTAGELAPGEDPENFNQRPVNEMKEYFV